MVKTSLWLPWALGCLALLLLIAAWNAVSLATQLPGFLTTHEND